MAIITNLICTSNKEIDIQSQGGSLNIGTGATTSTVTIGNTTSGSSLNITSGTGGINFNGTFTTNPVSSSTVNSGFGTTLTLGTAKQNTLGYDIIVNINLNIASATTATIIAGVGSSSTPSTNTAVASFSSAILLPINIVAYVPNNYYLLIDKTGTLVTTTINLVSCAV